MNYTFALVQQISSSLKEKLNGCRFAEAFSYGKNELFLNFKKDEKYCGIRLLWAGRSCYFFFNDDKFPYPVPLKYQFTELNNRKIITVEQHKNNRSFQINFEDHFTLVFKLYNGLSNVLLFENGVFLNHFRTNIKNDEELTLEDFNIAKPFIDKGSEIVSTIQSDIFQDLNNINREELSGYEFEKLKHELTGRKNAEIKKLERLIAKSKQAISMIKESVSPEEIGHIIMANLQQIKPRQTKVLLFDFYRNTTIDITLKENLTPQQNAEHYYRKGKNQVKELADLNIRIDETERKLIGLKQEQSALNDASDMKELKPFIKSSKVSEEAKIKLFKEFEFNGFKILVGKNAANNDLLTAKHAHKNDMWLHARGVGGSHVVLKQKSGKEFTKDVIEYAASVAAYFSKAKGSGLVPVVYTVRKYVRKPKGAEPGEVMVSNENVVLVKPELR